MNFWSFANESPLTAFLIIFLPIYVVCRYSFRIVNRYWRHKTIQKMGYPPAHCDADGDFKPEPEKEEEVEEGVSVKIGK